MCKESFELKFCSCDLDFDKSNNVNEFYWTLSRLIKIEKTNIRGKIKIPVNKLNDFVTVENVLALINSKNIFDFEYTAQENDTIRISNNLSHNEYNYFSIIYKNGEWEIGRNPAFSSRTESLKEGVIKID